ncbi:hypothetical protein HK099_000553 [Clydaea vesicula]|uniref:Signal recognition particle receptor subunit beta n=1 Tax=Clydaea vesicula TaxID=447962 RepID=A0AAD5XXD9_9FUNG|nr:hypothetical protein HK099_000553 [Clydaea vesicula]
MEDNFNKIKHTFSGILNSQYATILIITIFILVVAAYLFLNTFKKYTDRNNFLILGLSDSGKTTLFFKLTKDELVKTYTSRSENEGKLMMKTKKNKKKEISIVDVPGHERLRFRFSEYLPITKGLIFVIDSTQQSQVFVRRIAEYLYLILVNKYFQKFNMDLLILCNKTDLLLAVSKDKIKESLETELDHIRLTRTANVESQGENGEEEEVFLGYENEKFKFEHLPNSIEFEEVSVINDGNKCNELILDWISS